MLSSKEREVLVDKLTSIAEFAHAGQTRNDRVTPYTDHVYAVSIAVMQYCRQYQVDFDIFEASATALLHDVVEDSDTPLEQLLACAWNPYPRLFANVMALSHKINGVKMARHKHELWRDLRGASPLIKLVKVQDRIHNLQDFGSFGNEKKERIYYETRDYMVPLARSLDALYGSSLVKELFDLLLR